MNPPLSETAGENKILQLKNVRKWNEITGIRIYVLY